MRKVGKVNSFSHVSRNPMITSALSETKVAERTLGFAQLGRSCTSEVLQLFSRCVPRGFGTQVTATNGGVNSHFGIH